MWLTPGAYDFSQDFVAIADIDKDGILSYEEFMQQLKHDHGMGPRELQASVVTSLLRYGKSYANRRWIFVLHRRATRFCCRKFIAV